MSDKLGVFGNPIKHSLSPRIHSLFAEQTGRSVDYQRLLVSPNGFPKAVARQFSQGLAGANVTVPFKQVAYQLVTQHMGSAAHSGAVNTLISAPHGGLIGANTDGDGLVAALRSKGVSLAGRRILLLGAGGASRGVMPALNAEKPDVIWVWNRTVERAEQLASLFNSAQALRHWSDARKPDLIINATSASLFGESLALPEHIIDTDTLGYDMVYSRDATAFQSQFKASGGGVCFDGLGMLVEQAAVSFSLWFSCDKPKTEAIYHQLRNELAKLD